VFLSFLDYAGAMPGSYYSDVERTIFLTYIILQADVAKYNELFQAERKFISFEYWNEHFVHQLDFDDLVYGHEKLSEIVAKYPETKDGLTRFLYEIILRRMEIRDKSRSVNSIDIVFNFDCIGFTGTVRLKHLMAKSLRTDRSLLSHIPLSLASPFSTTIQLLSTFAEAGLTISRTQLIGVSTLTRVTVCHKLTLNVGLPAFRAKTTTSLSSMSPPILFTIVLTRWKR
jgi:hypothetical protein